MTSSDEGRIDILGCSVAGSPGGLKLIKDLEKNFRVNFAASDDITGSRGGVAARCSCCPFACCRRRRRSDMVLETDSVDLNAIYFDPDEIRAFNYSHQIMIST